MNSMCKLDAQVLTNVRAIDTLDRPVIHDTYVSPKMYQAEGFLVVTASFYDYPTSKRKMAVGRLDEDWTWFIFFDTTATYDAAGFDITAKNGKVYVASASFDSTNGNSIAHAIQINAADGVVDWMSDFSNPMGGYAVPAGIIADDTGNVYLCGTVQNGAANFAMYAIKYDSLGNQVWIGGYDSAGFYDGAVAMAFDPEKNLSVTGFSGSAFTSWDFVTIGLHPATGALQANVRSANASGALSKPVDVLKDVEGNLYVLGTSAVGAGVNVMKLIKYDTLFNEVWVKIYGDSVNSTEAADLDYVFGEGVIHVAGTAYNSTGGSSAMLMSVEAATGGLNWSRSINAAQPGYRCVAKKVRLDAFNQPIVCADMYNGGDYDAAAAGYDLETGNLRWFKTFSREAGTNDYADNIDFNDLDNNIVLAVTSQGANDTLFELVRLEQWEQPNEVKTDTGGAPLYIANQLIIKFAPDIVNRDFVDNTDLEFGSLRDIVADSIIDSMVLKTSVDFHKARLVKIYKHFHSYDTLSISRLGDTINMGSFWSGFLICLNKTDSLVESYCDSLNTDGSDSLTIIGRYVFYAEPNYIYTTTDIPDDGEFVTQNSLFPTNPVFDDAHINIDPAWDIEAGNPAIKVGVYDSGIRWDHDDFSIDGSHTLAGSTIIGGWDWVNNHDISDVNNDPNGHGTACAGIIGALRNNDEIGIAGIAGGDIDDARLGCQLFAMKVSDIQNGTQTNATDDKIAAAIIEGSYNGLNGSGGYGLHIINISWARPQSVWSYTLTNAIRTAWRNGVTVVAARGNFPNPWFTAVTDITYPACLRDEWLLNVGGTGIDGEWKEVNVNGEENTDDNLFSSMTGHGVDIAAPATTAIVRTLLNNQTDYRWFNGTSASAPHVAGVAALMMAQQNVNGQYHPDNLAPEDVEFLIERYAVDKGATGPDDQTGAGLLDAGNVMQHLDFPEFRVFHSGMPDNRIQQQVGNDIRITLPSGYDNLPAGIYFADKYQVTETFLNVFPTTATVLDGWARLSSTRGVSAANPVNDESFQNFNLSISSNVASVTSITYTWFIKTNYLNQTINKWFPYNVANLHSTYSLHIHDPSYSSVNDTFNNVSRFFIYPNPVSDVVRVAYSVPVSAPVNITLTDVTGKVMFEMYLGIKQAGAYNESIRLPQTAAGMYFCNLRVGEKKFTQKIAKTN